MTFTIHGFGGGEAPEEAVKTVAEQAALPRKSLVRVLFPGRETALRYFNDRFDLKVGDRVYVDGKLEGLLGRVTEVSHCFKIKLSDYQKVVALVVPEVHGIFSMAGSHFVTFDPNALPPEQVSLWFRPPAKEDEVFITGSDGHAFPLSNLEAMDLPAAIAQRGHSYYMDSRVRYLRLEGTRGYAIVAGTRGYAVEFSYHNGQIRDLVCECPCGCGCKHQFAAMLQLKETLEIIGQHYAQDYARSGFFAAIDKAALFAFAVDTMDHGSFRL